jgi:hypothetical protein
VLGKKSKKAKVEPDEKAVTARAIDRAMKDAAKGHSVEDAVSAAIGPEADMEVVEVILPGGAGYTVRALAAGDDEAPLLARDDKLLMFASLGDLVDFCSEPAPHTLSATQGWAAIAATATAGGLVAELLDSYDLTEVPELADGTAEDRWTAGLLVGYAIDAADTVGCPPLEALKADSALLTLEREPGVFESGKFAAPMREKLMSEVRTVWPRVLKELEARTVWWTVLGPGTSPAAERRAQEEAMRLAAAEAAVVDVLPDLPAEASFVIPSRTPEGRASAAAAATQEPAAPAYDWDSVGVFPIQIRLPRGSGLTLVTYPDDETTEFLGGRGHILLFAHPRGLLTYLRENPDHSFADLPGWRTMPPLDVAALDPTGFYYLHDVPDRLNKGLPPDEAEEVADAFLLAADMAKQLNNADLSNVVDPSGPLARFMGVLSGADDGGPIVSAFGVRAAVPMPTIPEAAAMWRRMARRIDDSVTWRN